MRTLQPGVDKLDVTVKAVKDLQGVRADMRAVVLIWVWILGDPHIFDDFDGFQANPSNSEVLIF